MICSVKTDAPQIFSSPFNSAMIIISDAVRCGTLNMDDNARAGIAEGILHQIPEDSIDERLVPFDAQLFRDIVLDDYTLLFDFGGEFVKYFLGQSSYSNVLLRQ